MLRIERIDMESISIQGRRKLNQRATLILLQKIEDLRISPIVELQPGEYEEQHGALCLKWRIVSDAPYPGVRQLHVTVHHSASKTNIVESIFYRSEGT